MAWNEEKRRDPSSSRSNAPENTSRWQYPGGWTDAATSRMSGHFTDDTRKARARLRLADWKPDERLERLEGLVADGAYKTTGSARIELGLYADARAKTEEAAA
jgi:hypothetical protein